MSDPNNKQFIVALDQGTTSSRAIVLDRNANVVTIAQREFAQIYPQPSWVEHDPMEIWATQSAVFVEALAQAGITNEQVAAIGITNQRETTIVWDRITGRPIYNAIVWQSRQSTSVCDQLKRDGLEAHIRQTTGLVIDPYFSGTKIKWILDHVEGSRERARRGELLFGTVDSWLIWKMTQGKAHVTDYTNASRTLLYDIHKLDWDPVMLQALDIPREMLPQVRSSSEIYGHAYLGSGQSTGIPIAGIAGDQQAALFGQMCVEPGQAKNTYGTGNFLLLNTGTEKVMSKNGLLTTVCYKIGDAPAVYALEGSIAVTGSLVQWLRDNLGMFEDAPDVEWLAGKVQDNGGAYFVPAFSGLFAPYWRPDARGALVGLTRYVNRNHIARAALEATAFQSREVVDAMNADSGVDLTELRVDGGMVANELLMQFQADQLGVDVVRPKVAETTALGAAYAAGIAVGFWKGEQDVIDNWAEDKRWSPSMEPGERERLYRNWKKAVTKTMEWVDEDVEQ